MFQTLRALCVLSLCFSLCVCDTYMHNPRGSNNRLNERSANRRNANRLFDSQNNNRGGYNAGDTAAEEAFDMEDEIYNMQYFQSGTSAKSYLTIEWTNQHGCGGNEENDPNKLNCNMVIQFMIGEQGCDPSTDLDCLRNGVSTDTQNYQKPSSATETQANYMSRRTGSVATNKGLHETFEYYDDCYIRSRNRGLFNADQKLNRNSLGNSSAIYTRQNPNGNRRGYECPEERDHYPYWHPSPWRDIAILTDNTTLCPWYEEESAKPKGICKQKYPGTTATRSWSYWNNQDDCEKYGGDWFQSYPYIDIESGLSESQCTGDQRVWAAPEYEVAPACLVLPPPLDCRQVGWTRSNHLGNGRDGVPLNYTWTIPYFPSGEEKNIIVRIRYNISTDDYDPFTTDSTYNQNLGAGIRSPVTQNPYINIGSTNNKPLRLAINTAQFGRTFQDRSHVIKLLPRSDIEHPAGATCDIYNLNVRGKRGNIVQVYPSVEYDFIPNRLTISEDNCLHIQWTGSNTHNNGNPGGDGQTGDAGEGRSGTDRSNFVQTDDTTENYPVPWEQANIWTGVELIWKDDVMWTNSTALTSEDIAVAFASSGYYGCYKQTSCTNSVEMKASLQQLLNNASPSFGAMVKFRPGMYNYICSRNNNFTNRSQKGTLRVTSTSS